MRNAAEVPVSEVPETSGTPVLAEPHGKTGAADAGAPGAECVRQLTPIDRLARSSGDDYVVTQRLNGDVFFARSGAQPLYCVERKRSQGGPATILVASEPITDEHWTALGLRRARLIALNKPQHM